MSIVSLTGRGKTRDKLMAWISRQKALDLDLFVL